MVTNMTEKKIKILRSDNGGEYTSKEFSNYLKEKGIQHQLSVPRTSQQNGVAERMNRTIQETARSMIYNAGQDKKFWAEAVCTAVIIAVEIEVLHLRWTIWLHIDVFMEANQTCRISRCLDVKCICTFLKKIERWDSKTKKCIFVGYSITSKGYRLYDPVSRKICVSRDVLFDEDEFIQGKKEIQVFDTSDSEMKKKYKRSTKLCGKQLKKTMIPLITRKVPVKKRMLYSNNNHDDQRASENLQINMAWLLLANGGKIMSHVVMASTVLKSLPP